MTRIRELVFACVLLLLAATLHGQTSEPTKEQAEKLADDAVALYASGDAAGALAGLDRALAIYRRIGDRKGEEEVISGRAMMLELQGQHAKALESFMESLAILREIGGDGEAEALDNIGATQLKLRQFAEAAKTFEEERTLLARKGDRKGEGEVLHNIGYAHALQMQDAQALEVLAQALAIRRETGDRDGEARTLDAIAYIHRRLGHPKEALEFLEKALPIWRELGETVTLEETQSQITGLRARLGRVEKPPTEKQQVQWSKANDLNNECGDLMRRGDYAGALAKCEKSRDLFRKAGSRSGEGMALTGIGLILFSKGDYAQAYELAMQALTIARETGDEEAQGNPLNNLALVCMARAQYPQALAFFNRVLDIQRAHHDLDGEARTLGNLAGLHVVLGELKEAAEIYEKLAKQPYGHNRTDTLMNLGAVRAMKKEFPEARALMEQVLAEQRRYKNPLVRTTLANLAGVNIELGEYAKALELLQEALALDRNIGDRLSESGDLAKYAELYARQGEPVKALAAYQQALALARETGVPSAESSFLAGIGRLHESQGKLQEALDAYLQAIALEETIRAGGQTEEIKTRLGERSTDVYARAVRLLVRLDRPVEAFDLAERARARTFLDQLGNNAVEVRKGAQKEVAQERNLRFALAGLDRVLSQERARPRAEQDAERSRSLSAQLTAKRREYADHLTRLKVADPDYASLVSISPLKLAEVQRLLDPETTLLVYFVTAEETLAFVVTRETFQTVELRVSEADLSDAVREVRSFADIGGAPSPSLARLSGWLIAPLLPRLKTPLVGIVPHGVLHLLPFAALRGSESGKWFGEEYTLFHLPTASALPLIERRRKATRGDLVAFGQGHAQGLPLLHYAEKEAQAVAALYETTALLGGAATETAFRERAGNAGILHIATHGQLNAAAPLFSRVVLAPDDTLDTERDGSLEVREIYGLDLKRASLVVLSACQSQLGAQSGGDDVVGLSRAFIFAGTPAVVASLWSVDDAATSSLMIAFYRNLRKGMGNAAALRAAQAETRAEHSDPYYWAAFVLTGDPK